MSALTLPEPENWSGGTRRLYWALVIASVFVVLGFVFGLRALLHGDVSWATVMTGTSLIIVLICAGVSRFMRGRIATRISVDSSGTVFRPDRVAYVLVLAGLAAGIPVGLVLAIGAVTGYLDVSTTRQGIGGAVVVGSMLAVFPTIGSLSVWRRGGVGYTSLSPSGVEYADILRTTFVPWVDIVAVTDSPAKNIGARKPIVLKRADETELLLGSAEVSVPTGVGLYWMVRHYWLHPEDRPELADGRAVQRLDEGRFDLG